MSKPIEYIRPRMNPKVNHRLWVIMMCQCRFINCNKCTTLAGDVDDGGGRACVEAGGTREIYIILLNFAANLKLLLQKALI